MHIMLSAHGILVQSCCATTWVWHMVGMGAAWRSVCVMRTACDRPALPHRMHFTPRRRMGVYMQVNEVMHSHGVPGMEWSCLYRKQQTICADAAGQCLAWLGCSKSTCQVKRMMYEQSAARQPWFLMSRKGCHRSSRIRMMHACTHVCMQAITTNLHATLSHHTSGWPTTRTPT